MGILQHFLGSLESLGLSDMFSRTPKRKKSLDEAGLQPGVTLHLSENRYVHAITCLMHSYITAVCLLFESKCPGGG